MEYKDTLLMPKTDFEMRGNLAKKEPGYVERFKELNLYELMVDQNKDKTPFILHDGPPYANGDMHIGHMMNNIIKDVIVRYKSLNGYYTPFIPGWDTHGLPIESAIQKLGVNRKEMSTADFRKKCEEYAYEQVSKQMEQLIRVGTMADYKHPYITLQKEYEAVQIDVFAKMALDGLIYKGLKPVYWSYSSESALAEAEIEYHDVKSPTIFVAFDVVDGKGVLTDNEKFVIWTTTPWTIPANLAICLNPDLEYAVVQTEKGKFVFLQALKDMLCDKFGFETRDVVETFKGRKLEGITTKHPLYDRTSVVILGDHVTEEAGTGCVHTAPGHGVEDFEVGMKYGLEVLCPVDEKGCMTSEAGDFLVGQHVDDANKTVVKMLDDCGALLKMEWITHSYPHDWRTRKPIIFRATAQWFASIDKIREQLLSEIDGVKWLNPWGHVRLYNMIRDRGDWCISRQRTWGVPIPIIYCEDGTPIMEKEVFDHISKLFRENGSNIWFEKEDVKDLLPKGYTNPLSPNGKFRKETDIMDVWFDSGSSHTAVLCERGIGYPADLYFEGSDQYRGWFNSSLITGVAVHQKAPYKTVLSHGMVLDGKGNKMSKSLGNGVDPVKLVNQNGADILRLWAASVAYQNDVRISDEIIKQVSETYRKIRNTLRFLLGNLDDFTTNDVVEVNNLEDVDKYMILRLNDIITETYKAFDKYEFSEVVQNITNYMVNDLSSFYLDFTKDILYIEKADSKRRRQVQTVIYHHVKALNKLLSPILAFTSEEVHDFFKCDEKKVSIILEDKPSTFDVENAKEITALYNKFLKVRDDVNKALEVARADKLIGKSLEANLKIALKAEYKEVATVSPLKQLFIVSSAEVVEDLTLTEYDYSYIEVVKSNGHVCQRCWNVYDDKDMADDEICTRCHNVLSK